MGDKLTATILNQATIEAYGTHRHMLVNVRIDYTSGLSNVTLTATGTYGVGNTVFSPKLKSSTAGTCTEDGNTITGIAIPANQTFIDIWFIWKESDTLTGEVTNVDFVVTPSQTAVEPGDGEADTLTIPLLENFDATGVKDKSKYFIGCGDLYLDGIKLGFFNDDGVTETPILETGEATAGQLTGSLFSFTTKTGWTIEVVLNQYTLDNLRNQTAMSSTPTQSASLTWAGGTAGEYMRIKPPGVGPMTQHELKFIGQHFQDGKTMRKVYDYVSVIDPGALSSKKAGPTGIPIKFRAHMDPIAEDYGVIAVTD
uniref:Uncharacterized protein n=1 Tax=viral metagenome TaxID=1070528 RepID=A0A6M3K6R1_9ZZZZ